MVGITNALNVVADGLGPGTAAAVLLVPADEHPGDAAVARLFDEIRAFYARPDVPGVFRVAALDPAYAEDLWRATRRAFEDNRLTRRLKEALAFAVSLTSRSAFGAPFHLAELRRLGVGDRGVLEVMGVTQMFSSYTKIADTLQLDPDMGDIAPIDDTPAPGGGVD